MDLPSELFFFFFINGDVLKIGVTATVYAQVTILPIFHIVAVFAKIGVETFLSVFITR